MPIESQDFQLKYAGTVLMIHVYIRAQQDLPKLQKNVLRAARGPRRDAITAWMGLHSPGKELGIEGEKFGAQRAAIEEFLQSSTTDVVVFHLCINTDTDPRKLAENITRAARGPRFDDVTSVIELYQGNEGPKIWSLIQQVVQQTYANPAAKTITL